MTRPKPPLVLIEAWVLRVRQLTKARKMRATLRYENPTRYKMAGT
jgi:hypothetical protein